MTTSDTLFYNSEQKERYFLERESSYQKIRLIMRTFFNFTKEFEEALGKDCCNFTAVDILNMYSAYMTRSWEQLLNFNSQLKIYTAWCLKENLVADNQNHYEEIRKNDMYNCLNLGLKESMILTREELEKGLREMPNISDQFLCLAFFEGLGGVGYSDFYELSMANFEGNIVHLKTRDLEVSDKLVEMARESSEEYQKYSWEGVMLNGYRKTDPNIVKDSSNALTDSEIRNTRKIQRRLGYIEDGFGKCFGYIGLKNSGRIDMIKRFMKEDKSTDIRETFERHKAEIEYRYGKLQRIFRWIEEYSQFF